MKCFAKEYGIIKLENGETIVFLGWINNIKGKQYFTADHKGKERIYHVLGRDVDGKVTDVERVR